MEFNTHGEYNPSSSGGLRSSMYMLAFLTLITTVEYYLKSHPYFTILDM